MNSDLLKAVLMNDLEKTKALLESGVKGDGVAAYAAANGHLEIVKYLDSVGSGC